MNKQCKFCPLLSLPYSDMKYNQVVEASMLCGIIVQSKYADRKFKLLCHGCTKL